MNGVLEPLLQGEHVTVMVRRDPSDMSLVEVDKEK